VIVTRPLTELDLVAFDLEATGVAHGHDRIVEIGAARFRLSSEGRVVPGPIFHALVDPGIRIPPVVSRITGIDDAMVAGRPRLPDVWPDLLAFLGDGAVVLAHAVQSDLAYLVTEAQRLDLALPSASFFCTLGIARVALPRAPRYGLEALRGFVDAAAIEGSVFHRAVADALHTRNLFEHCVRLRGARRLRDLGVTAPEPRPAVSELVAEVPRRLSGMEPAIAEQRPVWLIYEGGSKGRRRRPVTPLGFYRHAGVAVLRGWCHLDDSAKSFRCDRIRAYEVTGDAAAHTTN